MIKFAREIMRKQNISESLTLFYNIYYYLDKNRSKFAINYKNHSTISSDLLFNL